MTTIEPRKPWEIPVDTSVPWGEAPGDEIVPIAKDARHLCLEALREQLTSFTFYRSPDTSFRLSAEAFYLDGVDSEDTFEMPAVAVIGGVELREHAIRPAIIESSKDVFKRGYALLRMTEHTEELSLEIWTGTKVERRAILSAIDQIFSPVQQSASLRIVLPNYWHQTCRFTLNHIERMNDDGVKNRWRTLVHLTLDFPVVRLIPVAEMLAMVGVVDE